MLAAHRRTADAAGINREPAVFRKVKEEVKSARGLTVKRSVKLAQVSRASYYRFSESVVDGPDPDMKVRDAASKGEVLRYVGQIDEKGKASVKLQNFPKAHSFASLSGADNSVAFHTERYNRQPLVIQGPGAGPEVTAGGVFADLLRLASALGAPR